MKQLVKKRKEMCIISFNFIIDYRRFDPILIKNKVYMSIIIVLIIINVILISTDQVIASNIGNRLIYMIFFINYLLIIIGVTVKTKK